MQATIGRASAMSGQMVHSSSSIVRNNAVFGLRRMHAIGCCCPRCARRSLHVTAYLEEKQKGGTASGSVKTQRVGYAVNSVKEKLRPFRYEVGPLGANEVDIRVTHNGVCHTDIHMRDDDWGISGFPFIPGHEVVGVVEAVGSGVSMLQPGMRAGVGWIANSCRKCACCLRGEENICKEGYTGLIVNGNHGGFQMTMRAPADFTYVIPDGLDSSSAAPLLCAGVTVYAPLKRYIRYPGSKVAVMGVGGLGHLALQFAAKMGAEVTAIDAFADKKEEALGLGASDFMTWDDAISGKAAGKFDLLLNCASAKVDAGKMLSLLSTDGTAVQVGIPGGNAQLTLPLQDLVFNQKSMAGSIVGGRADMQEMLDFAAKKGIKPMVETMKLSQVNEAFDFVASGKARYRVVLETDAEPQV